MRRGGKTRDRSQEEKPTALQAVLEFLGDKEYFQRLIAGPGGRHAGMLN